MIPLYTQEEFQKAKSRQKLPLRCKHCGKPFYQEKHRIQEAILGLRNLHLDFCSRNCAKRFVSVSSFVRCKQCGNEFKKLPKEVKKSKNHFCSKSCSCIWHNHHKIKGTRVSKLEKWLASKLTSIYPDLEFHFNRKDAINSELDIYIPSLKLAFELNGIFHYEPIYGPEKLSKTQNNDHRKMQACLEAGIELCIIDTSHQKYFKEQTSMKFLEIIQNIILLSLSKIVSNPIPEAT